MSNLFRARAAAKRYSRWREFLILGVGAPASGMVGPSTLRGQRIPPQAAPADGYSGEKAVPPIVDVFLPPVLSQRVSLVLVRAKGIAADMFLQIGVQVRWRTAVAADAGCSGGRPRRVILLAFSWDTPSRVHPGATAYATPYRSDGACITVFLDRLKSMTDASPLSAAALLGHVLAHEMAHILQGTEHHSESGVLKDCWSQREIRAMVWRHLSFTDYDRLAILSGIGIAATRVDPGQST